MPSCRGVGKNIINKFLKERWFMYPQARPDYIFRYCEVDLVSDEYIDVAVKAVAEWKERSKVLLDVFGGSYEEFMRWFFGTKSRVEKERRGKEV